MKDSLIETIKMICEIFNKHSMEYLIVGGTSVAFHGYFRMSITPHGEITDKPDLDFWYNPTYSNYFHLLDTLEELGQDMTRYKEEQTPNPKESFFRYTFEDFTLDLLPKLGSELDFTSCYKKREMIEVERIQISFLCLEDLIKDKEASNRPKDIEDIEQLKKIRNNE